MAWHPGVADRFRRVMKFMRDWMMEDLTRLIGISPSNSFSAGRWS